MRIKFSNILLLATMATALAGCGVNETYGLDGTEDESYDLSDVVMAGRACTKESRVGRFDIRPRNLATYAFRFVATSIATLPPGGRRASRVLR